MFHVYFENSITVSGKNTKKVHPTLLNGDDTKKGLSRQELDLTDLSPRRISLNKHCGVCKERLVVKYESSSKLLTDLWKCNCPTHLNHIDVQETDFFGCRTTDICKWKVCEICYTQNEKQESIQGEIICASTILST